MPRTLGLFAACACLVAAFAFLGAEPAEARRGRSGGDSYDDRRDHDDDHDKAWDDSRGRGRGRRGRDRFRVELHHHEHHGVRWDDGRHSGHHDGWWLAFEDPRFEIESHVVGVQPLDRVLILETGEMLAVPVETHFHPEGDLHGFDVLARAVEAGAVVEIEGLAGPQGDGVFVALALKVEIDD